MFQRIKKSQNPTSEDVLKDLLEFHDEKMAITEKTYGSSRTKAGQTSYELLADSAGGLEGKTVLDLACGNGPLLEVLQRKNCKRLVGVDLAEKDIETARARCGGVELFRAPADSLPLDEGTLDVVFCHLALFLFNPVEKAVSEIGRVLQPGGRFSAVVGGLDEPEPVFAKVSKQLKAHILEENPHLEGFFWGDVRTASKEGLLQLLRGEFQNFEFKNFGLVIDGPDEGSLAERLIHYFYGSDLISEEKKKNLLSGWESVFRREDLRSVDFPLTLVCCQRS